MVVYLCLCRVTTTQKKVKWLSHNSPFLCCAGNPFGLDHTLTSGIISGTGKALGKSTSCGKSTLLTRLLPMRLMMFCNTLLLRPGDIFWDHWPAD